MVKRTCPSCNAEIYSADTFNDWECPYCGAKVPREGGESVDQTQQS
jgi:predicted RNA-binding Zn-ribbon protein involved in translation (DUF1610 family)